MNAGTATARSPRTEGRGVGPDAGSASADATASPIASATPGAITAALSGPTIATPTETAAEPAAAPCHHEPTLARTTAQLLHACAAAAGGAGLLCAAGAMLGLLMPAPGTAMALCALVLALLPLERLMCLRVRFDAGLFTDLARALDRGDDAPSACSSLDAALHALKLRGPATAPRPLIERVQGARRLAFQHALVALAQFALLMSALALRLLA